MVIRSLTGKTCVEVEKDYKCICKDMSMEGLTRLKIRIEHSIALKKAKLEVVKDEMKRRGQSGIAELSIQRGGGGIENETQ